MRAAASMKRWRGSLTLPVCVLFAAFVASLPASAQPAKSTHHPCDKLATTAQQTDCTQKQWQAADAALGNYFSLVTIELDGREVSALKQAQDAWLHYRKLNCAAEKALHDGSAAAPAHNSCMAAMAKQRLKEMQAMYGWRVSK